MAFEDSLIGNSDFDPQSATEDLIRHVSDEPLPANLDIRDLNTRSFARKINAQKVPALTLTNPPPRKTNRPLDLSRLEPVPPTDPQTDEPLDMSRLEPVNPPKDATPPPVSQIAAGGKAIAGAVPNMLGGAVKGAAALANQAQPYLASLDYDESGNVIGQKPVAPTPPLAQHPLYQAGQSVQDLAGLI